MKRQIVTALMVTGLSAAASAAPAKVTASIDSTVVEMGSRATITVNIADDSRKGMLIDLPEPGTEAENLDFISIDSDTFPAGYEYRILIQAFEPGTVTFAPFRYVVGSDTAESDVLTLKIMPVGLDSLSTINPMESVVNPPRRWYDYIPGWLLWVILGLAVAAAAVCLYLVYRKNGTLIVHRTKPVDPYEAAMAELSRLRDRKLAESGREKEYYTSLVDILRIYLERRFGINAMEMSSTQILATLRKNQETRDNQPRIKQILEIADFVKFANIRPMPDDNIKTFNNVVGFVEDTKPRPEPETETEPDKQQKKQK
ncbi:MAG: hypothetical protein K2L77_06945 [Muribaculaceae bacterium]|nr:hypothetical protein [Muribaculaceae bacterium]